MNLENSNLEPFVLENKTYDNIYVNKKVGIKALAVTNDFLYISDTKSTTSQMSLKYQNSEMVIFGLDLGCDIINCLLVTDDGKYLFAGCL